MKLKCCIVGNSHTAALRGALPRNLSFGDTLFDFFAIPGGNGPRLRAELGKLFRANDQDKLISSVPNTDKDGLSLKGYSAVLMSAAGIMAARPQTEFHLLNRFGHAGFMVSSSRPAISGALFSRCIRAALESGEFLRAISVVRSVFTGPVYVQTWPLPSPAVLDPNHSILSELYGDAAYVFLSWYFREQIAHFQDLVSALPGPIQFLHPSSIWLEAGVSPEAFASPDPWHLNKIYGALVLRQLNEHLSGLAV
jgi:hypothetical protein